MFSSNKHWWQLRSFSPLETNALAYHFGLFEPPLKGRLRQGGTKENTSLRETPGHFSEAEFWHETQPPKYTTFQQQ